MRLIIPKKVRIFGIEVGVERVKHLVRDFDKHGRYLPQSRKIELDAGLEPQEMVATLWEEIFHVVESDLAITIKHADLERFRVGIAQVLLDNLDRLVEGGENGHT